MKNPNDSRVVTTLLFKSEFIYHEVTTLFYATEFWKISLEGDTAIHKKYIWKTKLRLSEVWRL